MKTSIVVALSFLLNMHVASAALSDNEIAGVVQAINNAEIKISGLAATNTTTAGVSEFGAKVVSDHTMNNEQLLGLFSGKSNVITPSARSQEIDAAATKDSDSLASMKDKLFDDAFLDNQIAMDESAISELDGYIGQAVRPEFKQFLTDTREVISKNLEAAKILKNPPAPNPIH